MGKKSHIRLVECLEVKGKKNQNQRLLTLHSLENNGSSSILQFLLQYVAIMGFFFSNIEYLI